MPGDLVRVGSATARVIKHSKSAEDGSTFPTVHLRYPRMVHADFLTHRKLSRNGRSSRAVPVITLLEEAKNPYVPNFLKNQPGMVGGEPFDEAELSIVEAIWRQMADACRQGVAELNRRKVHKQWANRPLEWFGYIDVLASAVELENFWTLRDEEGAQPEIQDLVKAWRQAIEASTPELLHPGEWHLPYVEAEELDELYRQGPALATRFEIEEQFAALEIAKQISTARCARLTIRPFDGDGSLEAELRRYEKLMVSRPVHASPAEHVVSPDFLIIESGYRNPELHGNTCGWVQHRKEVPFEFVAG